STPRTAAGRHPDIGTPGERGTRRALRWRTPRARRWSFPMASRCHWSARGRARSRPRWSERGVSWTARRARCAGRRRRRSCPRRMEPPERAESAAQRAERLRRLPRTFWRSRRPVVPGRPFPSAGARRWFRAKCLAPFTARCVREGPWAFEPGRGSVSGQLGIVLVPFGIAGGFLVQVPRHGRGEVDTGLVGQADEDEEDVGHLVTQIATFVRFLEALVTVGARHEACQFPDLLHENGGVGQFREITDAMGLDPGVDGALGFCEGHGPKLTILHLPVSFGRRRSG